MIVAIANPCDGDVRHVGSALAQLREHSGRSVKMLAADPACRFSRRGLAREIEELEPRYQDIVVATDGRDGAEVHSALVAARLVIVPVGVDQVDLERQYQLIARLNAARMFNPGLHVMFVIAADGDPSASELSKVRAYVGEVMSATLCRTVLHQQAADADLRALYREVFLN